MLAITLYEPYASLVACSLKRFETRSWPAPFGSSGRRLAIHAARKWTPELRAKAVEFAKAAGEIVFPDRLETEAANWWRSVGIGNTFARKWKPPTLGRVLCTVELKCCRSIDPSTSHWQRAVDRVYPPCCDRGGVGRNLELAAGDWSPGRYAWELGDVQVLDDPPLAVGRQRLWKWEP